MKRNIIIIDEKKCTGCGACIPGCPEGAIQIIDNKARLVSDLFCDGLGACLGHCPEGAISIEVREAGAYDENLVMEKILPQGENTIRAHLLHLQRHGEKEYLSQAVRYLLKRGIRVTLDGKESGDMSSGDMSSGDMSSGDVSMRGCPAAGNVSSDGDTATRVQEWGNEPGLCNFPVQLHLVSPMMPVFRGKDLILAADCAAYAMRDFHERFLNKTAMAIACPKLDSGREIYLEKHTALIEYARITSLTVITMEVPCCTGLLVLAREAQAQAKRLVPIRHVVVSVKGRIMKDEWLRPGSKKEAV
ncbi:MAG: 4Fe-4S binding protein [Spirochaetes bacterium]|nr:4Fe-4S binding protein [Spirochaetota bacterium]